MSSIKSQEQIAIEINKLPKTSHTPKLDVVSNRVCNCGRKIGNDESWFLRIEPGEPPEVFCEFCISINN